MGAPLEATTTNHQPTGHRRTPPQGWRRTLRKELIRGTGERHHLVDAVVDVELDVNVAAVVDVDVDVEEEGGRRSRKEGGRRVLSKTRTPIERYGGLPVPLAVSSKKKLNRPSTKAFQRPTKPLKEP